MENDNGDRLCQWRWLALTPVALSVLLFSFLVVLTRFFFSEVFVVCSSRFEKKIPTNKQKNKKGSPNLGTTAGLEGTLLEKMQNIETRGDF